MKEELLTNSLQSKIHQNMKYIFDSQTVLEEVLPFLKPRNISIAVIHCNASFLHHDDSKYFQNVMIWIDTWLWVWRHLSHSAGVKIETCSELLLEVCLVHQMFVSSFTNIHLEQPWHLFDKFELNKRVDLLTLLFFVSLKTLSEDHSGSSSVAVLRC